MIPGGKRSAVWWYIECQDCGNRMPAADEVCPACGESLPRLKCQSCDVDHDIGVQHAHKCPACGKSGKRMKTRVVSAISFQDRLHLLLIRCVPQPLRNLVRVVWPWRAVLGICLLLILPVYTASFWELSSPMIPFWSILCLGTALFLGRDRIGMGLFLLYAAGIGLLGAMFLPEVPVAWELRAKASWLGTLLVYGVAHGIAFTTMLAALSGQSCASLPVVPLVSTVFVVAGCMRNQLPFVIFGWPTWVYGIAIVLALLIDTITVDAWRPFWNRAFRQAVWLTSLGYFCVGACIYGFSAYLARLGSDGLRALLLEQ